MLKKAFNDERTERLKLQAAEMRKVLNNLTPIYVPKPKDDRIVELEQHLAKVKHVSFCVLFIQRKKMLQQIPIIGLYNVIGNWCHIF